MSLSVLLLPFLANVRLAVVGQLVDFLGSSFLRALCVPCPCLALSLCPLPSGVRFIGGVVSGEGEVVP